MTSMRRELGSAPDRSDVAARYVRRCAAALEADVAPGDLTPAETAAIERMERQLGDEANLARPGGMRRPGVKIHEDVYVVEAVPRLEGNPVRMTARLRKRHIEDITLTAAAARPLGDLEAALAGLWLEPEPVRQALEEYNARCAGGLEVAAWTHALLALEKPQGNRP